MKPIPKWLMIPPAIALLLVLGPLSMANPTSVANPTSASTEPSAQPAAADTVRARPSLPQAPSFWKIGSALIGVLLLGGLGLYGLRRLRGGAIPTRGTTFLTLRQSMRLGQRQALHAVEFDDRILLIGETERGISLIESAKSPNLSDDEAEVTTRAAELLSTIAMNEDGAVPKNLQIPRPPNGPSQTAPRQPVLPRPTSQTPGLGDFRALLQKAGR